MKKSQRTTRVLGEWKKLERGWEERKRKRVKVRGVKTSTVVLRRRAGMKRRQDEYAE